MSTMNDLRAPIEVLRQLGADLNRGANIPNLAEQIWDQCDILSNGLDVIVATANRVDALLDEALKNEQRAKRLTFVPRADDVDPIPWTALDPAIRWVEIGWWDGHGLRSRLEHNPLLETP